MKKKETKEQFNIGDRFIVTISEKYAPETESPRGDSPKTLYRMNGFKSLVFDEEGLRKLKPYKQPDIEAIRDDAYYNGAREAWDLAHQICSTVKCGGLSFDELQTIFGTASLAYISSHYTFTEAKDKVEAWRAKKDSLKPGDVVKHIGTGELAIVATFPEYGSVCVVTRDGLRSVSTEEYTKTDEFFAVKGRF